MMELVLPAAAATLDVYAVTSQKLEETLPVLIVVLAWLGFVVGNSDAMFKL